MYVVFSSNKTNTSYVAAENANGYKGKNAADCAIQASYWVNKQGTQQKTSQEMNELIGAPDFTVTRVAGSRDDALDVAWKKGNCLNVQQYSKLYKKSGS
ncbi:hypothetical protein [Photobacterium sanguinicancri]|uniref:Uncharacterized protein n=1 Tax=Photobacterium sanguinicancri TaxID=875932 RepID=A0ABX4G3U7_9GAMM|nr:hypothetical protein [Photobacterium sanguinicancri]OZS45290.1 hypothetical protein ASV53_03540 [Photobacterium sanguinicancri]